MPIIHLRYVKFIATYAPTFFGYIISVLAIVTHFSFYFFFGFLVFWFFGFFSFFFINYLGCGNCGLITYENFLLSTHLKSNEFGVNFMLTWVKVPWEFLPTCLTLPWTKVHQTLILLDQRHWLPSLTQLRVLYNIRFRLMTLFWLKTGSDKIIYYLTW